MPGLLGHEGKPLLTIVVLSPTLAQLAEPAVGMQEYLTLNPDLLLTPCGLDLQPYSADRMLASIRHPLFSLRAA